jgi:hypothetical protein
LPLRKAEIRLWIWKNAGFFPLQAKASGGDADFEDVSSGEIFWKYACKSGSLRQALEADSPPLPYV